MKSMKIVLLVLLMVLDNFGRSPHLSKPLGALGEVARKTEFEL